MLGRMFLIAAFLFLPASLMADDGLPSFLDGEWSAAHVSKIFSIDTHAKTATYCSNANCMEGAYTVLRTVSDAIFIRIASPDPMDLAIYVEDQDHIHIAETGGTTYSFQRPTLQGGARPLSRTLLPNFSLPKSLARETPAGSRKRKLDRHSNAYPLKGPSASASDSGGVAALTLSQFS